MDNNSTNFSNSSPNSLPSLTPESGMSESIGTTTSASNSSSIFEKIQNITPTTWLIIILVFAFLGFNIFVYLAKGTQDISNFFGPFFQSIFGKSVAVTSQTVDVAAEGAKAVVGGTATAVNTGLTTVQNVTPNAPSSSLKTQPVQSTIPPKDITENNTLNKALNSSQQFNQNGNQDYQAYEEPVTGKAGWCFIGEDRGFRTCAEVSSNDMCMSGDIFPTQEICINPNLRP